MFATQAGALLSPSHMALGSTNREAKLAAGEVFFFERHCRSKLSKLCQPGLRGTQKQPRSFVFEPASSAHSTKAQTNRQKPPQYLRTASTAEQPSIGPEQSSKVHTAVRSCRPERKQADKKEQKSSVAESHHVRVLVLYVSFFPLCFCSAFKATNI